jgi:hypothetical protein
MSVWLYVAVALLVLLLAVIGACAIICWCSGWCEQGDVSISASHRSEEEEGREGFIFHDSGGSEDSRSVSYDVIDTEYREDAEGYHVHAHRNGTWEETPIWKEDGKKPYVEQPDVSLKRHTKKPADGEPTYHSYVLHSSGDTENDVTVLSIDSDDIHPKGWQSRRRSDGTIDETPIYHTKKQ